MERASRDPAHNECDRHETRRIRVLIADDHAIVSGGLKAMLASDPTIEVVATATTVKDAVECACNIQPDIVLMDISIPQEGGVAGTRRLRNECPATRVIALTVHEDAATVRSVLDVGASGYLLKTSSPTHLSPAINAVYQGRTYLDPALSDLMLMQFGVLDAVPPKQGISRREKQVLQLVAHGYTNHQVAERLSLGIKTVESYRARLSAKLGLADRAAIVRYAICNGLLRPDDLH